MVKAAADHVKVIATNRKATHDFHIHERYEAGIVLVGSEVKSLRDAKVTMLDGWVEIRKGQAFLHGIQINEYSQANRWQHEIARVRKLLMHKREIRKLVGATQQEGYTLIPLELYLSDGFVKVELALGKGKKNYDKRADEKKRDATREIQRAMRK
jgi:SsrA-binding protein